MATWQDRQAEAITLSSPETKTQFSLPWISNDWKAEKRLGKFAYPKVEGTKLQDLGASGFETDIPLHFEGKDCDSDSWKFAKCAGERGLWSLTHPVRGQVNLQLVSLTVHDSIASGNLVIVDTSWIDPDALGKLTQGSGSVAGISLSSAAELGSRIKTTSDSVNTAATSQFAKINKAINSVQAARDQLTAKVNTFKSGITDAISTVDRIGAQFTGIITDTTSTLESIAGLTQQLIEFPGLFLGSLTNSVNNLGNTVKSILGYTETNSSSPNGVLALVDPDNPSPADAAAVAAVELVVTAGIVALAQVVTSTDPLTRAEAVAAQETVLSLWADTVASFDAVQAVFVDVGLSDRYFSQSESYTVVDALVGLTAQYLAAVIFSLKTEVRFTLASARHPLEIAISYYGSLGWDDSYFDLFIASNNLHGNDILLLPAGREVLIYA